MAQLDDALVRQASGHVDAGWVVQAHAPGSDLACGFGLLQKRFQTAIDFVLRPRVVQEQDVDVIYRQLAETRIEASARLRHLVHARSDEPVPLTTDGRAGCRRSSQQRSGRSLEPADPSQLPGASRPNFVAIVTWRLRPRRARPNSASAAPSPYIRATSKCVRPASIAASMRFRRRRADGNRIRLAQPKPMREITRSASSRWTEAGEGDTAVPVLQTAARELTPRP